MSGYLEGVLVLLAVNVVFAYGGFLPLAAGQLNLGLAGFAAIGAYASAYLSNVFKLSPLIAIPFAGVVAGAVALIVAVPVLRTRGIYLALATFALGQIVQAIILNLEVVGGAAGYPVAAFIRLPTIAAAAGKIAEGSPEDIRQNPLVQETYLGAPAVEPMERHGAARSA